MKKERPDYDENGFPTNVAQPLLRALAEAGYTRLEQLAGLNAADLLKLHGVGRTGIDRLQIALKASGLSFADRD